MRRQIVGVQYYVDPNGSDGSAGTSPKSAWSSFRNIGRVHPGDRLSLRRGGTWRETLSLPDGSARETTVIDAYGDGARPVIDGTGRDFCVAAQHGQGHVVIRDLDLRRARSFGIYLTGGAHDIVVDSCALHDHGVCGYNAYMPDGTAPGLVVRRCEIYRNQLGGLMASGRVDGMLIEGNRVFDNCLSDALADYTAGIRVISDEARRVAGVVAQANIVYGNGRGRSADRGYGIWYDTVGRDAVIRWNLCFANNRAGIQYEFGGPDAHASIYGNIAHDNETGISISRRTQTCLVTNNTCVRNQTNFWLNADYPTDPVGMWRNTFRNNIGWNAHRFELRVTNGAESSGDRQARNVFRRNCFGVERPGFIEWGLGRTIGTYAALDRLCGAETASVAGDPRLEEGFSLAPGSPCIGAGEAADVVTGFGFAPFASPPDLGAVPYWGKRSLQLGPPFCGLSLDGGFAQEFAVWTRALPLDDLERLTRKGT